MAGACVLSTGAALRSGAGLVKAAVPEEIFPILQIAVPQATCTNVSDQEFLRSVSVHDAIGIGPGMGVSEKKYQLIEEILSIFDGPVVIDADGITNLCRFGKKTGILKKKDNIILTPHPGECDRLLDALDLEPVSVMGRVEAAEAVSDRTGAVVLLKGADTVVTSGSGSTYINTTGNPGLSLSSRIGHSGQSRDRKTHPNSRYHPHHAGTGVFTDAQNKNIRKIHFLKKDLSDVHSLFYSGFRGDYHRLCCRDQCRHLHTS